MSTSTITSRPVRRRLASILGAALLTVSAAACVTPPAGGGGGGPACGTGAAGSDTAANGAVLTVTPATNVCTPSGTVTISGTGYKPTANGGVGIYVVYGPKVVNGHLDAGLFGSAKWVNVGAPNNASRAPMNPDGSFSTTLSLPATYTDAYGTVVNCQVTQCHILTFTAHGVNDRTQDADVAVDFAG